MTGTGGDRWAVGAGPSGTRAGRSSPPRVIAPASPGPGAEEAVMSEESVPPQGRSAGQPKGLLEQMEELMAALNADLSALDADLQRASAEEGELA